MSLPAGFSATSPQATVMSARPGLTVKTRQQRPESCDAARTNVTPSDAVSGPGVGSDPLPVADDVQARSASDTTTHPTADRTTRPTQTSLALPADPVRVAALAEPPQLVAGSAVDALPQQVGVPVVPRVLLDHMLVDPPEGDLFTVVAGFR